MIIDKNTGKAELCFVKAPEYAWDFRIEYTSKILLSFACIDSPDTIELPEGNWQIVGNPFEIDKDQCKAILKDKYGYHLTVELPESNNRAAYFNARVAMDDWLKHLQIYQTNPYGSKKPIRRTPFMADGFYTDLDKEEVKEFHYDLKKWEIAEERTGPWILLIKTK